MNHRTPEKPSGRSRFPGSGPLRRASGRFLNDEGTRRDAAARVSTSNKSASHTKKTPPSGPAKAPGSSRRQRHPGSEIFSDRAWAEIARSLRFTKRELQIVRGVFDDRTEFAIAADLGISPHTVHTHLERLRHKLAVMDRAALVLQVVEEFLRLTGAPRSRMPSICGRRAVGLCPLGD